MAHLAERVLKIRIRERKRTLMIDSQRDCRRALRHTRGEMNIPPPSPQKSICLSMSIAPSNTTEMQPKPHLHTLLRGFGCNSVFDRKAETAFQTATRPIHRIAVKQIRGTMPRERAYSGVMVAILSPKPRRLFIRTSQRPGTSTGSVTAKISGRQTVAQRANEARMLWRSEASWERRASMESKRRSSRILRRKVTLRSRP